MIFDIIFECFARLRHLNHITVRWHGLSSRVALPLRTINHQWCTFETLKVSRITAFPDHFLFELRIQHPSWHLPFLQSLCLEWFGEDGFPPRQPACWRACGVGRTLNPDEGDLWSFCKGHVWFFSLNCWVNDGHFHAATSIFWREAAKASTEPCTSWWH